MITSVLYQPFTKYVVLMQSLDKDKGKRSICKFLVTQRLRAISTLFSLNCLHGIFYISNKNNDFDILPILIPLFMLLFIAKFLVRTFLCLINLRSLYDVHKMGFVHLVT